MLPSSRRFLNLAFDWSGRGISMKKRAYSQCPCQAAQYDLTSSGSAGKNFHRKRRVLARSRSRDCDVPEMGRLGVVITYLTHTLRMEVDRDLRVRFTCEQLFSAA